MGDANFVAYTQALSTLLPLRVSLLISLSILTLCVEIGRSYLFGVKLRPHLIKNLSLGWIPLIIVFFMCLTAMQNGIDAWTYLQFVGWMIMFPNSIYLITEVHHFNDKTVVPLWFDNIGILLYVLAGITLSTHSLLLIHWMLLDQISTSTSWMVIACFVFLAAFGVYLGRNLRFYSWDVIFNPYQLFHQTRHVITHNFLELCLSTILFGVLILSCYAWDILTLRLLHSI